jgi:hypothetical protein
LVALDIPGRLAPRVAVAAEVDGGDRVPVLGEVLAERGEDPPVLTDAVDADDAVLPCLTPAARFEDHLSLALLDRPYGEAGRRSIFTPTEAGPLPSHANAMNLAAG